MAHEHGHGHSHAPARFGRAFAIGVALNATYVVLEVVFGLFAHSITLVADAGHNLGDVLSLILAWVASILVRRPPSGRRTYGWRRSSILTALINAVLLLVTMGGIAWEAIRRFGTTDRVEGKTVIWVAAVGILINGATALLFMSGRKGDLNIRAAFVHMASDAGLAVGVVIAGSAILLTGKGWIDPVTSLIIVAIVLYETWDLLRDSVNLALDAVPEAINPGDVRVYLAGLPDVRAVHDLHIWAMSTTETALTAHLIVPDVMDHDGLLAQTCEGLHDTFGIEHATLQIETGNPAYPCHRASADVV
ncbi:MAG: cation diffusion facilitator family transporter [Chloroflexota bacterium]|nr:cation diffusion facilitator family transporter [Chloroflexota bacterium]